MRLGTYCLMRGVTARCDCAMRLHGARCKHAVQWLVCVSLGALRVRGVYNAGRASFDARIDGKMYARVYGRKC